VEVITKFVQVESKKSQQQMMFCQICLSTNPSSLVGIRGKYFEFNHQQIDYLDCFTYCKQIKIKDELNAKLCTDCMLKLKVEYTLKQGQTAPTSSKAQAVSFNITFPDVDLQRVHSDPGIKAEPELQVDADDCDDDDSENTPGKYCIQMPLHLK
jgi:hypothetical protein